MEATALGGISVVDFSETFAGAVATQLLADFGADVVVVEPPRGSRLRRQPAWPAWGRGKRSAVLDLHDPAQRGAAQGLAGGADVVIETWRPGVAERLGLSYDALAAVNPRLVHASITAFGRDGPLAGIPGYEALVMAKAGGLDSWGGMTPRPGPAFVSTPFCSWGASQVLLHGVLAALFERETSGCGQRVETSLLHALGVYDCWNWLLRLLAARYPDAFRSAAPVSREGIPNSPLIFRLLVGMSADGRWMQFSQTTDRLWQAFLRAVGQEELLQWPGIIEEWEPARRSEFWDRLLVAVQTRTHAEWSDVFDRDADVWAEVFRHGTEQMHHPQITHDGQTLRLHDPVAGDVHQPGPMVRMTATPARPVRGAPPLGRDTDAVLADRTPPLPAPPAGGPVSHRSGTPLAGVTVLELATFFAAPYGATLLCDLGARVIKIEQLDGDPVRNLVPFPEVTGIKVLQGKESIAVDVTTDDGRSIVHDLARRADAVLQSFRAGVAERFGFDAASLLAVNPDLVYLNAPGYGTGGPCGRRPAFAPTIGAGSGLAMRNLGPSVPEEPGLDLAAIRVQSMRISGAAMGYANADGCSALGVATALLLGLVARRRGAPGQEMLTTMLSTLAHTLSEDMVEYDGRSPAPAPDPELYGIHARYRLYETGDGWVFLAAPRDDEWARLHHALGPWGDLPDAPGSVSDAVLATRLGAVFRCRAAAEWEDELTSAGVGCVAVAPSPVEDRLMTEGGIGPATGLVTEVEHPVIGRHTRIVSPVRFSRSTTVAEPACLVGQHTDAVLKELGYGDDRIAELRAGGVIG